MLHGTADSLCRANHGFATPNERGGSGSPGPSVISSCFPVIGRPRCWESMLMVYVSI
jgi:hypothetical protein